MEIPHTRPAALGCEVSARHLIFLLHVPFPSRLVLTPVEVPRAAGMIDLIRHATTNDDVNWKRSSGDRPA